MKKNRNLSPVNKQTMAGGAWTRDCTRRFMVGFHVPDYDQLPDYPQDAPAILSKFDARDFVRSLKRAHVQMFWFYNKCHMGNSYHPSAVPESHVHSGMRGRDYFGELTQACLDEGIVPGCVYEFSDHRVMRDRPEWCHRIPDKPLGDFTDAIQGSRVGGACLNGPYGDYAIAQTVETISRYPIQGYYVDFLGFFGHDNWLCPHGCNASLARAIGVEFQGIDKLTHAQYVAYLKWKFEQYDRYCRRMLEAMRAVRPDIVFLHNAHLVTDQPNLQTYELAGRNCDYVSGDLFALRAGSLQMSWILRSYAGASRNLPSEALLDTATCIGGDFGSPKARDSYRAELWTARAVNVTNCASISMNIDGTFDREIIALVREVYAEQKPFEPWLRDMRFQADVGLVRSQNTILYRPGETQELPESVFRMEFDAPAHALEFKGWAQILAASHFLWDVVQDYQVTADCLKRFKTLVLPDAGCLSAAQCRAVVDFARAGGAVIVTGETALFDENGVARDDFALAQITGGHRAGPREIRPLRLCFDGAEFRPRTAYAPAFVYHRAGVWPVKAGPGTKRLATFFRQMGERTIINAYVSTGHPALLRRQCGKGTVYYFAGLPGMEYRVWGFTSQKRLARDVLAKALGRKSMLAVDAPETVEVFAHTQEGQDRLVVNLVNWVSGVSRSDGTFTMSRGKVVSNGMRFDEAEKMPPAAGVRVCFRPRGRELPRRVCLGPDGQKLPLRPTPQGVEVEVPVFDVHAMLAAEY